MRLYHAELGSRRAWAIATLREQGFGDGQAATVLALLCEHLRGLVTNPYHAMKIHDRLVPRLRPSGTASALLLETLYTRQSGAIWAARLTALGALGAWFALMWLSAGGDVGSWDLPGGVAVPVALLSAWAVVEHLLIRDLSDAIRRARGGDGLVVPVRRSTGISRDGEGDHRFLRNRIRAIVVDAMKDRFA
ncbi:MAG: hypothetical protein FJW23_03130 [Acidimicrobiia bacterium]|nr:hypothetical protein [Acidimicrobiia bacterium]